MGHLRGGVFKYCDLKKTQHPVNSELQQDALVAA